MGLLYPFYLLLRHIRGTFVTVHNALTCESYIIVNLSVQKLLKQLCYKPTIHRKSSSKLINNLEGIFEKSSQRDLDIVI
jgi:hypothetical protein